MATPEGGNTQSWLERARAVEHVKVKIGDVGSSGRVGGFA